MARNRSKASATNGTARRANAGLTVLAAIAATVGAGACPALALEEVSRTSYREYLSKLCSGSSGSIHCELEFPKITGKRRLELRNISCFALGGQNITKTEYGPVIDVIDTANGSVALAARQSLQMSAFHGSSRFLGANQPIFLPVKRLEYVRIGANFITSPSVNFQCTITGDLVTLQ